MNVHQYDECSPDRILFIEPGSSVILLFICGKVFLSEDRTDCCHLGFNSEMHDGKPHVARRHERICLALLKGFLSCPLEKPERKDEHEK
jgi:hypothetical protein